MLKYIKSNEKLKDIAVIILSTSSTPADENLVYENRANGYITKPFGTDDIMKALSKIAPDVAGVWKFDTGPSNDGVA